MKKDLFNLIKLIALGVLFSVGAAYVLAGKSATAGPPNVNAPKPINISSTPQSKGGNNVNGELLSINGGLSVGLPTHISSLAVFNNAVFGGDLTISGMTSTGQNTLCAQTDGTIIYCPLMFPLQVANNGSGSGTIASNVGGINCGPTCASSYLSGAMVTLTATAQNGGSLGGWSGGGCSGKVSTCTTTVNALTNVYMKFNPPCQGYPSGGYCWYMSTINQASCTTVCGAHGAACNTDNWDDDASCSIQGHFGRTGTCLAAGASYQTYYPVSWSYQNDRRRRGSAAVQSCGTQPDWYDSYRLCACDY